ncbi:MAG: hypothetical protein U5R31_00390 [Acidimicrobiia bacterium]|nr:hypothetical protein [Acidimicrobiia bacterium]
MPCRTRRGAGRRGADVLDVGRRQGRPRRRGRRGRGARTGRARGRGARGALRRAVLPVDTWRASVGPGLLRGRARRSGNGISGFADP